MIYREEIFAYVKEKYDIEPDYPWFKHPKGLCTDRSY